jgi:hypothetical protein
MALRKASCCYRHGSHGFRKCLLLRQYLLLEVFPIGSWHTTPDPDGDYWISGAIYLSVSVHVMAGTMFLGLLVTREISLPGRRRLLDLGFRLPHSMYRN